MSALPEELEDRLIAAVELVGRSGARGFETGFLEDDVPIMEADWWASATYKGAKITVEHKTSPIEAAEALAERLLTGSMCNHCKKLVALREDAGFAYFRATLIDGRSWNAEDVARLGLCHWRREGRSWKRGCEKSDTRNREQRRGKQKRRRHR